MDIDKFIPNTFPTIQYPKYMTFQCTPVLLLPSISIHGNNLLYNQMHYNNISPILIELIHVNKKDQKYSLFV